MRQGFSSGRAIVSIVLAAAGVLAVAAQGTSPRDVHMVVRNMTYYLDGSGEPNPTLRLRPGEKVRIVLRNEDAGMHHDFVVPDWDAATGLVAGKREAGVVIQAPSHAGRTIYHCTPHAQTMRGTILVE
jgi:plastocyanin